MDANVLRRAAAMVGENCTRERRVLARDRNTGKTKVEVKKERRYVQGRVPNKHGRKKEGRRKGR